MGFKVGDDYRTNPISVTPGGVTVTTINEKGQVLDYENIKQPYAYIKTALKNPDIIKAYIKKRK